MASMIRKLALAALAMTALAVAATQALGGGQQTVKIDSTITV